MRLYFLLLSLLLTIGQGVFAETRATDLGNGLRVVVKEDHRSPTAVLMIWYKVGSSDEPGGISGISHALEHLMFKGTPNYPLGVFSKTIAGLGGQENAFTSTDFTAYFEKFAVQHLETGMKLEADRMQHLVFDPKEFAKEMKVIQEERRLRTDDNPQALTLERFLASAHLASPYHHPVIGWMHDIQQLQIADVKQWYARYYAPNQGTIVVVGDVQPDDVFKWAETYFGHIKPSTIMPKKQQIEPPALGEKWVKVKTQAQLPLLIQGYTVPSVKTATQAPKTPYALEIIATLLDAGDSGRLNQDLIRDTETAVSLGVDYNLYTRYETQFMIYGMPKQNITLDQLSQEIQKVLKTLKSKLVQEDELNRVKQQLLAQKTFEKDTAFGQAMELGLLETIDLGWQTADQYQHNILSITPEDIQNVAQQYFVEDRMTRAYLIPKGD